MTLTIYIWHVLALAVSVPLVVLLVLVVREAAADLPWDGFDLLVYCGATLYLVLVLLAIWRVW